jgi:pyruvate dehydrogenase E2 component (dihydrolipoamide acetyltransferase)
MSKINAMTTEIKLPELGENIETAEVITVLVAEGDTLRIDQPVIELETDKATAEVPSDQAGVVREVLVREGEEIKVGQAIMILEPYEEGAEGDATGTAEKAAPAEPASEVEAPTQVRTEPASAPTPPPSRPEPEPDRAAAKPDLASATLGSGPTRPQDSPAITSLDQGSPILGSIGDVAPAAPAVRRLARELGIDINEVRGDGPGGRISEEGVKTYARQLISRAIAPQAPAPAPAFAQPSDPGPAIPELPDFSAWGDIERERASKIRRVTAETLSVSWNQIPHVTQFDRADITELNDWRKRYADKVERSGGKLTITAVIVKAVGGALKVFPKFNASYDARNEEIVYKKYVNIGVAVDTDRGLLVPVLKGVDRKNIAEISIELGDLAERARSKKIQADELQGGNINVSNLGGLGTTYFSPIVAWPQVAVLGVGRATNEAVYQEGGFVPRLILPLSLSYDHRLIDGADAARFLRWIAEALEQPLLIALEG